MVILKMGKFNSIRDIALRARAIWSRKQLKEHYSFACRAGCFEIARAYLYALYGRKGRFYHYECHGGTRYAYEYPEIGAKIW